MIGILYALRIKNTSESDLRSCEATFKNVAKCNLGKVNLKTMLASGLPFCVT